jgi:apolipoprotein D and lipocalin family protein
MKSLRKLVPTLVLAACGLAGCASNPPIPPVAQVDLKRFMGDWYVIAAIPSFPERNAYNAVESYSLGADGRIQTTFRFREGGFDGEAKTMRPVGTVVEGTNNAVWGMQFIWPIKAEYIIADLDADYRNVIVARTKRDYVWIMARTPQISDALYETLKSRVAAMGYDTAKLRKVPQQWPEPAR